jgi:protein-tyrosine-phosphatase
VRCLLEKGMPVSSNNALNVLFLCTHNSARSILAEALLNHLGADRFKAFSAGSSPRENQMPNPIALRVLQNIGIETKSLHSKNWDVFAVSDAPQMDLIITVCDNAAGEVCPIWPGHPATAHWGFADPSEMSGNDIEKEKAFELTMSLIQRRIEMLLLLPVESIATSHLQTLVRNLANQTC